MLFNILFLRQNSYHGGSVLLRQKVRIILLVVELVDHHALLEIVDRHFNVCILVDVSFCICLLIADLCRWVFFNLYLMLLDIRW